MKDITPVVKAAKRIESLLEEKLGARGRGLHEKLTSVERRVPAELQKKIRYIATVRNKAVHEDDYELDNLPGFLSQAEFVARALEDMQRSPPARSVFSPAGGKSGGTLGKLAFVSAVVYVAIVAQCARSPTPATQKPADTASTQLAEAASTQPSDKASTQPAPKAASTMKAGMKKGKQPTAQEKKEESTQPTAAQAPSDNGRALFAKGEHVALDSPLLKVEKLSLAITESNSGSPKPRIQLTVRNTSTKTLSSARYDARLFIDSQPGPVVDEHDSRSGRLFLSFGDQGLKPGEATTNTVTPDTFFSSAWVVPDILNARRRQLVIRNTSVADGMNQSLDVEAPPFTSLPSTTPLYTASASSAPALKAADTVDFTAALRDGVSAGAGNQALALRNVKVAIRRGDFDKTQPVITLDVTNIGERTLSRASIQAQLYIDGQTTPVIETGEETSRVASSRNLFTSFGERGLAPGQTLKVTLRPDTFFSNAWKSPDVLNAKSHLVLLRVISTQDGMEKPYGGIAQELP